MATSLLSPSPKQRFETLAGAPAAGFRLFTYAAGTTTPQATYSDRAGLAANANPIILNARGECVIYLTPGLVYDYVLKSGTDVAEWTQPGVIADAGDASAVGFTQSGTGAVTRTVQSKLRDHVSVKDFGAVADFDGTTGTDCTTAFQAFFTAIGTSKVRGYIPAGDYRLTANVAAQGGFDVMGDGRGKSRLFWDAAATSGLTLTTKLVGSFDSTIRIEGLGLFARAAAVGTGLKIIGDKAAEADRITARVLLRDIQARGATHPTTDGWHTAIHLSGVQGASLADIYINGKVASTGEPNYDSVYGLLYNNEALLSPHPGKLDCWNVNAGYCKTGLHAYDFEGLTVVAGNFTGNTGIYAGGPANFPGVFISKVHANCSDSCITIDGLAEGIVTDCELYKELGTNTGKGVWLKGGATFCQVRSNVFTNTGSTVHQLYGVLVEASDDNVVDGNTFRAVNTPGGGGIAVWFASGNRNQYGINKFGTTVETPFTNNATATIRADGKPSSGTYTPTIANVTNVAASTPYSCQWLRVGDVVTVSGSVDVTPTAASATAIIELSLPIPSNLGAAGHLSGSGATFTAGQDGARIYANDTNDSAILRFYASGTAAVGFSFTFTYRVL